MIAVRSGCLLGRTAERVIDTEHGAPIPFRIREELDVAVGKGEIGAASLEAVVVAVGPASVASAEVPFAPKGSVLKDEESNGVAQQDLSTRILHVVCPQPTSIALPILVPEHVVAVGAAPVRIGVGDVLRDARAFHD